MNRANIFPFVLMVPDSPRRRVRARMIARQRTERQRREQADRAAHRAVIAARQATLRLLGPAGTGRASWRGHGDGTAAGTVDGLSFSWVPAAGDGPGHLTLHRWCGECGRRWTGPADSAGQFIGALVADHCGCARRARRRLPAGAARPEGRAA